MGRRRGSPYADYWLLPLMIATFFIVIGGFL